MRLNFYQVASLSAMLACTHHRSTANAIKLEAVLEHPHEMDGDALDTAQELTQTNTEHFDDLNEAIGQQNMLLTENVQQLGGYANQIASGAQALQRMAEEDAHLEHL